MLTASLNTYARPAVPAEKSQERAEGGWQKRGIGDCRLGAGGKMKLCQLYFLRRAYSPFLLDLVGKVFYRLVSHVKAFSSTQTRHEIPAN